MRLQKAIYNWINQRFPLDSLIDFLNKPVSKRPGWGYTFGTILLAVIIVEFITGVALTLYYAPTPDHARDSIDYIRSQVMFGKLIFGLHVWGASFIVILFMTYILHLFFTGGYKSPRELTWVSLVVLGLVTFGLLFTGYLLPWDQKSYWGSMVRIHIAGSVPLVGHAQQVLLQAGDSIGALTLTRFFSLHVVVLPLIFFVILGMHLYLVRKHGIVRHDQTEPIPESEQEPFFPRQATRLAIVALIILSVLFIVALKIPASLEKIADPTDSTYVPRPEWYFLFLNQLLRYYDGHLQVIGTTVIPTAGVILLFLLPFIDRNPRRSHKYRPFAITFGCIVIGILVLLTVQGEMNQPLTAQQISILALKNKPMTPAQSFGNALYTKLSCVQCHNINGVGNNSGLDLAHSGNENTADWMITHFKNPQSEDTTIAGKTIQLSDLEISELFAFLLRVRGSSPDLATVNDDELKVYISHRGAQIFQSSKCITCHKVDGNGGESAKDLTLAGVEHDPQWLAKFVDNPNSIMTTLKNHPAINLTPIEKEMLVSYLSSLTTKYEKPVVPVGVNTTVTHHPIHKSAVDTSLTNMTASTSALTPKQLVARGMSLYDKKECYECHVVGDDGGGVNGPDLTFEGKKHDDAWHLKHFADPKSVVPGSKMPKVKLPEEDLKALTAYIQSLQ